MKILANDVISVYYDKKNYKKVRLNVYNIFPLYSYLLLLYSNTLLYNISIMRVYVCNKLELFPLPLRPIENDLKNKN